MTAVAMCHNHQRTHMLAGVGTKQVYHDFDVASQDIPLAAALRTAASPLRC